MKNNSSVSLIKRHTSDLLIHEVLNQFFNGKDACHCQTFDTSIFCVMSTSKVKESKTIIPNEM